ncbi:MAG: hypothetical protein IIW72_03455, partial [Clostridia bacterium]|nr:hypothetical protein [Clostridia bacterium]
SLQYYYENKIYAYGITVDGEEIISLRKANGIKYDMLCGAGKVNIVSNIAGDARILLSNDKVKNFTEGEDANGNKILTVNYEVTGLAVDEYNVALAYGKNLIKPSVSVIYTFYENSIGVDGSFKGESEKYILSGTRSKLNREHCGGYDHNKEWVKVNSQWIYPENLDDPYQEFESLAYIYSPDTVHKMYTFFRGENLEKNYATKELRGNSIYLTFADANSVDAGFMYSLTFADAESEKQNPDYLGLFRSRNDDFAVGIAPQDTNTERSTVFMGDSVKLNINVTNLKNSETKFSLRYDVRNYYGDMVSSGLFVDNVLSPNADANRLLEVSGKYGMYYLNLYAISENTSYKECYPFALIQEYDYQFNSTSPFGISTVTAYVGAEKRKSDTGVFIQNYSQFKDLASISAKIGISNARTGTGGTYVTDQNGNVTYTANTPKYVEYLQRLGIDRFIAHQGETFESLYRDELDAILENGPVKPVQPVRADFETEKAYNDALNIYNTEYAAYMAAPKEYRSKYEEFAAEFYKLIKASADSASKFAHSIESGTEMNIHTLRDNGATGVDTLYNLFYHDTFLPSFKYVTSNYPQFSYVPTSFSAAESGWLNHLADSNNKDAIWDKFEICSLH